MKRLQRNQKRRGAAMVEMALVLPIFVTVVLGIVEFGRAMMVAQMCTNAAREGVRLAVLDSSTNAEVEQAVKDLMVSSAGVSAGNVTATITITPAAGNPNPGNNLSQAGTRDLVRVRVSVPFDQVAYVSGDWLAGKTLASEAAMRHE
jgi:Flp pilus assembly protein TadG